MTVAAVILAASPASALADADGAPAVRRIADSAWAGGATPIVVVAVDPDGDVASALATAAVTLLDAGPAGLGPAGQIARGMAGAARLVGATSAAIVWPVAFAWADAETVTTLIGVHGEAPGAVLRPSFEGVPGWPALIPMPALEGVAGQPPGLGPAELLAGLAAGGLEVRSVDTGDPGTTHDLRVPRSSLPPFEGPPRPDDGVEREWGAPAAAQSDHAPPAGPARLANADPAS